MTVTLGGFAFQDLEIPESISWGGPHLQARHQLIGGDRVFDAMGDDPRPIEWSGIFLYGDAADRAREVEAMKASGGAFLLTWGSFSRQVVIKSFDPDYQFEFRIPYRICCEVIPDGTGDEPGLGDLLASDFATLAGLPLGDVALGALTGVQAAIGIAATAATSGQLVDAPLYALQTAAGAAQAAADTFLGMQAAADAALPEVDLGAIPGLAPVEMGASLLSLAGASGTLSDATVAAAYMSRIAGNLGLYGG